MVDLIELLFNEHPRKAKLFITWDAASWHSSAKLEEWMNEFNSHAERHGHGPLVVLVPLPRCAQFLNVIEAVFSAMARAVIHHSDYSGEEEMKSAISKHFVERNRFFRKNPRKTGKKIWDVDFFEKYNLLRSGAYREW